MIYEKFGKESLFRRCSKTDFFQKNVKIVNIKILVEEEAVWTHIYTMEIMVLLILCEMLIIK